MAGAIDAIKILGSLMGNGALSRGSGSNVLGNVLGAALGGSGGSSGGGALGGLLGSVLGGSGGQSGGGGALGSVLGSVLGGSGGRGGSADLGAMLGAGQGQGGGLGGLGGLLGAAMSQFQQSQGGQARAQAPAPVPEGMSRQSANDSAELLIRAMVKAAKSDGQIDETEQKNILGKMGDLSQDEVQFLRNEFAQPVDAGDFARSVPRSMAQQVYAVSLMAIDLDTNKEAKYLHELGTGLGISPEQSNQLHAQLGAPQLYS